MTPLPHSLLVMRHGRTCWNRLRRLQGRTDNPLDCGGRLQSFAAVEAVRPFELERIVTSPPLRAEQTARILAAGLSLPIEADPRLVERDFGSAEGDGMLRLLRRWRPHGGFRFSALLPPDAEGDAALEARVAPALEAILADSRRTLVVTHAHVIETMFRLLGVTYRPWLRPGRPFVLEPSSAGPIVRPLPFPCGSRRP